MAIFAEIDGSNVVLRVVLIDAVNCLKNGVEDEATGASFCSRLLGGSWIQTEYNGFRKHLAGIGYTYNPDMDAFIPPQPYPSWTLDADAIWQPPVAMPTEGGPYQWDEENEAWEEWNDAPAVSKGS